ncbi:hypothetical protein BG000_007457 [Podila horticola]|nr:hypothetical protein BG000_007457 [Podila horticola]
MGKFRCFLYKEACDETDDEDADEDESKNDDPENDESDYETEPDDDDVPYQNRTSRYQIDEEIEAL